MAEPRGPRVPHLIVPNPPVQIDRLGDEPTNDFGHKIIKLFCSGKIPKQV